MVGTDNLQRQICKYILRKPIIELFNFDESTKVMFLAQGEYNINYLLQTETKKYVFRINTGSQLQLTNQIKYEYDSIRYLESSGVTPKAFFVDDTCSFFDYGILVMEFLEGVPLNYERDLHKAAHIFSKIHSLPIGERNHFIVEKHLFRARIEEGERLLTKVWDSPHVNKDVKLIFDKLLDWTRAHLSIEKYFLDSPWHVINNTEVNSHNFIIGEQQSYLIDWEKPVISDPAQDLTQFLAPTTTLWKTSYRLKSEEKEAFFKTYISSLNGADQNIRERVHLYTPYLLLRALAWCASALVEYQNPTKQIKNDDTLAKIKEFLQADFMVELLKEYC